MPSPDEVYQLLRNLTSPVVAVTAERGGKRNGMILDSAIRASIVPTVPRLSVYIHKFNFSHDLVFESGCFVVHLLRTDQLDLVHHLGFQSGRTVNKLAELAHHLGSTGAPVLENCYAYFECRVANVMDTGSSTCFLGDVVAVGGERRGDVMTAAYFRANIPPAWMPAFETQLRAAQEFAAARSRDVRAVTWRGLKPAG